MLAAAPLPSTPPSLSTLPDEVMSIVFTFVPVCHIPALAAVSSRCADILRSDDSIWGHLVCAILGIGDSACGPIDITGGEERETSWRRVFQACTVAPPASLVTHPDNKHLVARGLMLQFAGPLGRDRAVRTDTPVPRSTPFVAVRLAPAAPSTSSVDPFVQVVLSDTYYFEASIIDEPLLDHGHAPPSSFYGEPCVSIGLSNAAFPLRTKQCGWDKHSIGYHGDDGVIYHRSGVGLRSYGPRFGAGDVVGCGLHLPTMQCFFTHNGRFLGPAFAVRPRPPLPETPATPLGGGVGGGGGREAKAVGEAADGRLGRLQPWWQRAIHHERAVGLDVTNLYPTVGIDSHQTVVLNFGSDGGGFRFDPATASQILTARPAADLPVAFRVLEVTDSLPEAQHALFVGTEVPEAGSGSADEEGDSADESLEDVSSQDSQESEPDGHYNSH